MNALVEKQGYSDGRNERKIAVPRPRRVEGRRTPDHVTDSRCIAHADRQPAKQADCAEEQPYLPGTSSNRDTAVTGSYSSW